jgi:ATP phosphoribosyltransferase
MNNSLNSPATITIALPKGRILEETLPLLKRADIHLLDHPETTRKLILNTSRPDVRIVIVRASDVPTYVSLGAADLGISGWDTLMEHNMAGLYSLLDLKIAQCRVCVAAHESFDYKTKVKQGARLRVATKYTETTRTHFAAKGVHIDVVKLYGSMELAPLTNLADVIVDLVSTGNTLKANHLVEVEEVCKISSHLVANIASLKLKQTLLKPIVKALSEGVESAQLNFLSTTFVN